MKTEAEEVRLGLLLEGQISDLGINYNINHGLIETESLINITRSKVISNVVDDETTSDAIHFLLENGFNFIITTSDVQAVTALQIASIHTNIYFLIFVMTEQGSYSVAPHTRVATYYYNEISPHYILGYLIGAAAQDLNIQRVGMVVPGPPTENYYTSNAFYQGLIESNNTVEFMVIATSSYNDPDTSDGAYAILNYMNIDVITQSQTTMSVAIPMMYQSKLALGTNGFPQSMIYGTKVIQSAVFHYSVPFVQHAQLILDDNWPEQSPVFFGDFKNGFIALDDYSYLISEPVRQLVNDKVTTIAAQPLSETDYLCNDLNIAAFGDRCISYDDMLMDSDKLYGQVNNLGYYAVPTSEVYATKSINTAFRAVSAVEIGTCIIIFAVIAVFFRHNVNFTYSTLPFCAALLLGACLVGVAIILWNLKELNAGICNARIWMASLGYTILLGMIIVKNTLIHRKFQSMIKTKNDKISPIPFKNVLMFFTPLLVITIVLLGVYTGIGEVDSEKALGLDGIGKYEYTQKCYNNSSGNVIVYVILIYHGLMLLYGCFITWETRVNDLEEFAEVHDFASSVYLITFCSFIIIPLMAGIQVHRNRETIISACGIFTSFSCILIIFGAKFWKVYKPVEDDGLPQIKLQNFRSNSQGKSSSGETGKSKSSSRSKSLHSRSANNNTKTKDISTSVNIQNFVNPIESQSRVMEKEKEREKERVQEILNNGQNNTTVVASSSLYNGTLLVESNNNTQSVTESTNDISQSQVDLIKSEEQQQ